ncbi:MAG: TlpA family protein disulfide reductase [Prevotella sp.]|nr:TlpA family protein disulfide reductase [Prevotella sp.]
MNKKTIITAFPTFRRLPVAFLLALVTLAGQGQETKVQEHVFAPVVNDTIDFVIEGTASEGADTIYLDERPYVDYKEYPVEEGKFRITVRQPLHKFLQIEDGENGWMVIIVDSMPARITVDFRTNKVVEGSPLNLRFNHYQLAKGSIEHEMEQHMEDEDRTIYDSLDQKRKDVEWKSIIENLDNVIPVYVLSLNGQAVMYAPEKLAECMKEEYAFAHHPEMEKVWKYYWAMQKRLPGQDYHELELPDTTGTVHRLSEYVGHGNYVLLDFWASWCGPCMGSMPMMKEIHNSYVSKGLKIIGISFDSERDKWLSAIQRLELPWLHLSDLRGWESIASETYGVRAIPETVLIDPNGKILLTGLREQALEKKLDEIFNDK